MRVMSLIGCLCLTLGCATTVPRTSSTVGDGPVEPVELDIPPAETPRSLHALVIAIERASRAATGRPAGVVMETQGGARPDTASAVAIRCRRWRRRSTRTIGTRRGDSSRIVSSLIPASMPGSRRRSPRVGPMFPSLTGLPPTFYPRFVR